jgi:hypothetical protein
MAIPSLFNIYFVSILYAFILLCVTLTELVPTDYEKIRAMNMMKNNQLFQRLGLGQLKSLVTATAANNKEDCPQQSESLYDGENTDNSNEEVTTVLINS